MFRSTETPSPTKPSPGGRGLRQWRILAFLAAALACGEPGPAERSAASAPAAASDGHCEAVPPAVEGSDEGDRRRSEGLTRGAVAVAVFEGEFVGGGLPEEPTQAIPLDLLDLSFVLEFRVSRIVEGEIPGGRTTEVAFAVHSPAILFGREGIPLAEGQYVPEGSYRLTLWEAAEGGFDLEIVPSD